MKMLRLCRNKDGESYLLFFADIQGHFIPLRLRINLPDNQELFQTLKMLLEEGALRFQEEVDFGVKDVNDGQYSNPEED